MREIEFRGKTVIGNKWVYGWLNATNEEDGEHYWIDKCLCAEDGTDYAYQVDPETIGQYTGLKDKNGKRMFDGDIVKYHTESISFEADTIGVIEFCEGTFGIASNKNQHFLSFYNMSAYVRYVEVIGNIFDNGELLNED